MLVTAFIAVSTWLLFYVGFKEGAGWFFGGIVGAVAMMFLREGVADEGWRLWRSIVVVNVILLALAMLYGMASASVFTGSGLTIEDREGELNGLFWFGFGICSFEVRAVAAAGSRALIGRESRQIAAERFEALGLKLTFGEHVDEQDMFGSSSVKSRVEDLHAAFSDKNVKAVLTVIGGYNSNQLLDYIDWSIIKNNPKIFCGFSDITALGNAIYARTGLVTYYGPHYSTFGQKLHFDYTLDYFKKCLLSGAPFEVLPSKEWSDDLWFMDQNQRELEPNPGWKVLNEGEAK